uniref:Uncharacterized protein n=1 Tax=Lepeophtheirus salmonis TaxID=72036 RepID=A0A0K2V710_LEPSM
MNIALMNYAASMNSLLILFTKVNSIKGRRLFIRHEEKDKITSRVFKMDFFCVAKEIFGIMNVVQNTDQNQKKKKKIDIQQQ